MRIAIDTNVTVTFSEPMDAFYRRVERRGTDGLIQIRGGPSPAVILRTLTRIIAAMPTRDAPIIARRQRMAPS